MKSRSKKELAQAAGISYSTFRRWMQNHRAQLQTMGVNPCQQIMPPRAVDYICQELGLHPGDFYQRG